MDCNVDQRVIYCKASRPTYVDPLTICLMDQKIQLALNIEIKLFKHEVIWHKKQDKLDFNEVGNI